jgi:monofunctional glycosyltransferase
MRSAWRQAGQGLALLLLCGLALQLYFLARVALMQVVDPQSTSFQRSEAWRLLVEQHEITWRQQWVDDVQISNQLRRAVIASEDAGFADHNGVEWDAIEGAWQRNQRAEQRAERINDRVERQAASRPATAKPLARATPKLVGGSTITQQLAKNLFLSGERTVVRKAQEFLITFMLEALLDKRRLLTIYLNNVEWGEGVFGAEAAAQHYFRTPAAKLGAYPAARLAVMLPAPKRFEKQPGSAYVTGRASTIAARMGAVEVP